MLYAGRSLARRTLAAAPGRALLRGRTNATQRSLGKGHFEASKRAWKNAPKAELPQGSLSLFRLPHLCKRLPSQSALQSTSLGLAASAPFFLYSAAASEAEVPYETSISATLRPAAEELRQSAERPWYRRWLHNVWLVLRGSFTMAVATSMAASGAVLFFLPVPTFTRNMWTETLMWLMCRMGPCMIKLGQWAATRPDLFPQELCHRLAKLHRSVPTHSYSYTEKQMRAAYGKEVEEVFREFDREPMASGAIAQVYTAVTHEGQKVAVKVRHPHVTETITQDLRVIRTLTHWLEKLPGVSWMNLEQATTTFMSSMINQVNLLVEAENLETFAASFADFPNVCFPKPVIELCSEAVLVESFEEGVHISDFLTEAVDEKTAKLKRQLATLGFNTYLKMIFIDNLIHADLHPGNILVRELRPGVPEVVLLDVGLVTTLKEVDRKNFLDLFMAVAAGNGRRAAEMMIARARDQPQPPSPELAAYFQEEIHKVFQEVTGKPLSEIRMAPYFVQILGLCRQCHVKIESNFTTMVSGLIVVEGLARQLNADFDLLEESKALLAYDPSVMNSYLRTKLSSIWN